MSTQGFPHWNSGNSVWANCSEQSLQSKLDLVLQYGHFYLLRVWHVCLAKTKFHINLDPKKCLHPPKHVLTMLLNDWCFSLLPFPHKKKKKTCSTPLALHCILFSKPIFHTIFNQSPLNSALYGKVAKATPAIKAASSIPTPTHGNWAVTPMKKHQDKDNTNMSSTPTGVWHTDAIRCEGGAAQFVGSLVRLFFPKEGMKVVVCLVWCGVFFF